MYCSTMLKETKEKAIAFAVSKDGFRWEKRGLCLMPDEGSLDENGCARCTVFRNAVFDESTSTWSDSPGYTMLYEGVSSIDNKHRIMMAESSNGRKWTKKGVVFDIGEDGAWDSNGVGAPHILRYVVDCSVLLSLVLFRYVAENVSHIFYFYFLHFQHGRRFNENVLRRTRQRWKYGSWCCEVRH